VNGLIHLIIADRDDNLGVVYSYYACEPQRIRDGSGEYAGGFESDITNAITFDNILLAHINRKRLQDMYSDIPAKMKVITMTTKELFKARLGG